jgi:hypothetical protein
VTGYYVPGHRASLDSPAKWCGRLEILANPET